MTKREKRKSLKVGKIKLKKREQSWQRIRREAAESLGRKEGRVLSLFFLEKKRENRLPLLGNLRFFFGIDLCFHLDS